ncbi:hypothetical protein AV530_015518 [Patagioenas fasciata monilis]|uniref:Uncharacterized protein n=1 Tax=Patagioenas fasciata monilis TaxID=372326 RepID=A0A1V4KTG7_PATFA|nr:hypothetical protein AV530_015518 [Patagioenas fasciata monilis]
MKVAKQAAGSKGDVISSLLGVLVWTTSFLPFHQTSSGLNLPLAHVSPASDRASVPTEALPQWKDYFMSSAGTKPTFLLVILCLLMDLWKQCDSFFSAHIQAVFVLHFACVL